MINPYEREFFQIMILESALRSIPSVRDRYFSSIGNDDIISAQTLEDIRPIDEELEKCISQCVFVATYIDIHYIHYYVTKIMPPNLLLLTTHLAYLLITYSRETRALMNVSYAQTAENTGAFRNLFAYFITKAVIHLFMGRKEEAVKVSSNGTFIHSYSSQPSE